MIEDDDEAKAYDARLLARFLGYLRPHAAAVAGVLAVLVASIFVELAAPFVLRAALDGPVARGDAAGLWAYGAVFLVIAALTGLFEGLEHYLSNLAGQSVIYDLRAETFAKLQRMPVAYYDRNPVGRLLTRVTGDIENLSELFTSGLVGLLSNALLLLAILVAMLVVEWRLTLVTLGSLPLVIGSAALFRAHARRTYRDARKAVAAVAAYLNESIGGVKTIQAFNRQELCAGRFAERNRDYRDRSIKAAYVYSFFWPGIELLSTTVTALILWRAGKGILAGTMSFGTFLAFWYLVRKFFEPIQELAEKYNILQAAMASSERIFKILDAPLPIDAPARPSAPPRKGEVEFREVRFHYEPGVPVLKGVSFRVAPGETVALVGYTGAGKTSILSLLLRLYDPQAGVVLVDGVDVRDFDPRALRRRFGMVFQEVQLFSGTVEDNLRMGAPMGREQLERAIDLACARRVLERLPKGYATDLMERGSALSAGERQLLSFARAVAGDPPMLILDEATSSVDAETEGLIQEAVAKTLAGRSAIVVAHRLSTIRRADRILVLHHGELREQGTHEELLKRGGLYEKLYRLQWRPEAKADDATR